MSDEANTIQLEKGRISALQLGFLSITLVIATADIFLPSFVAQEAQEDSWISVIAGTASSFLAAMIFITLAMRYPDRTLVQYSCDILGKPLGKLVGAFYVFFLFDLAFAVNRELGEIFVTAFNPDSPLVVYCAITVIVAAYAAYSGLEVIARVNEFVMPIGILILGFISIINIKDTDLGNFAPTLANGILPPLRGGLLIQGWMLELVVILQFIPYVKDKNKIRKVVSISVIALGLSMMLGVLTIAVFGMLTSRLLFPALEYVRYASIGYYIQNLDITIMGVWITGIFIKISAIYYAIVLSISQLFGFSSKKELIAPVGLVIIAVSIAGSERLNTVYNFSHYYLPFFSLLSGFIIPSLLLLVSLMRKRKASGSSKPVGKNKT